MPGYIDEYKSTALAHTRPLADKQGLLGTVIMTSVSHTSPVLSTDVCLGLISRLSNGQDVYYRSVGVYCCHGDPSGGSSHRSHGVVRKLISQLIDFTPLIVAGTQRLRKERADSDGLITQLFETVST